MACQFNQDNHLLVYYTLQVACSVCFPGLPTLDLLPKTRNLPTCAIWLTFLCTSLKTAACQENHPLSPPDTILWDFPGGASILPMQDMQETWVQSLGQEDPLEEEMAAYSSILARRIPWTEETGRPQSIGLHRVRHN